MLHARIEMSLLSLYSEPAQKFSIVAWALLPFLLIDGWADVFVVLEIRVSNSGHDPSKVEICLSFVVANRKY